MSDVFAGAISGMVMAMVFIPVGTIVLFVAAKDPSPGLRRLLEANSAFALLMTPVVVAFPVWGVVGAILGLSYALISEAAPGGGLGSSNGAYTIAVLGLTPLLALPFAVFLRQMKAAVVVTAIAFAGIFGWFLPLFAN